MRCLTTWANRTLCPIGLRITAETLSTWPGNTTTHEYVTLYAHEVDSSDLGLLDTPHAEEAMVRLIGSVRCLWGVGVMTCAIAAEARP